MKTVADLKAKLPEADVIALDPDVRYLILVKQGRNSPERCYRLHIQLRDLNITSAIAIVSDTSDFRIFELEPSEAQMLKTLTECQAECTRLREEVRKMGVDGM